MENKLFQGIGCIVLAIVIIIIQSKGRKGVTIATNVRSFLAFILFMIAGIMLILSYFNNW